MRLLVIEIEPLVFILNRTVPVRKRLLHFLKDGLAAGDFTIIIGPRLESGPLQPQARKGSIMNRSIQWLALAALATIILVVACDQTKQARTTAEGDDKHVEMWTGLNHAVAVLNPTASNSARGEVHFMAVDGKVKVVADIEGLGADQKHAIHIHQFGDITGSDGKATGGHYNPEEHDHGLPETAMRHAGDLGNIQADSEGKAHYEITVDNISIAGRRNPIIGRGVIVHAKTDTGEQPTGGAGPRIAQGVIGIAKSK